MRPALTTSATPSVAAGHPVTFTRSQERTLDQMIALLRTGAVSDAVLEHLEVDGVLHLEPLVKLSGGDPSGS